MEKHFKVLGVSSECSEKELKKAYKSKALELHPDKNPSPEASQKFSAVKQAYEALMNPQVRKAQALKAEAYKQRQQRDSSARERVKKFREELRKREQEAQQPKTTPQTKRERPQDLPEETISRNAVKVKWTKGNSYTKDLLFRVLCEFGPISKVVKKEKTALVVFENNFSADNAVKHPPHGLEIKHCHNHSKFTEDNIKSKVSPHSDILRHKMNLLRARMNLYKESCNN